MILASGCFDGLHAGHVRYLHAAQRLDPSLPLWVTIVPDAYIRATKQREPHWPQADRAFTVSRLKGVAHVISQAPDETVPDVIRRLAPTYFVKGPEWDGALDREHLAACVEAGTTIHFTRQYGKHWADAR